MLCGDALSAIGSGMTLPFFVVYLHRVRGIDLEVAGLAVATIAVASLAGNATGGLLTDRAGSRRAVLVGLALAAVGTASIAFVSRPWEAFAAAAATGLGVAVFFPAFDSLLAVTVTPEQRSSVFAVRHATMNAGLGIGGLFAAAIVDFGSPRTFQLLYLLDAASFLVVVPLLFALRGIGGRPEPEAGATGPGGYRSVLRDRVFLRVAGLTVLLFAVGYAQLNAAFPAFATGPGGIGAKELGVAFAVNTLAVTVLQLPVLRLAQGRRRSAAVSLVFVLWAATWAVTLIAGEFGHAAAVALFVAAAAIFALGETLMSPAVPPLVNDLAPDRLRGRYNAVYTLALTTGYILGPAIAGVALGAGHGTVLFLALIGACVAAAFGALRLQRSLPAGVDLVGGFRAEMAEPTVIPAATSHG